MTLNCSWCGEPITPDRKGIGYDGGVFHLPCAAANESGTVESPVDRERRERQDRGLWGFTTPPAALDLLRKHAEGD